MVGSASEEIETAAVKIEGIMPAVTTPFAGGEVSLAELRQNLGRYERADLDGYLFLKSDPVIGGAQYDVGEIAVTDAPGHGADIDPDFLKLCESITVK